MSDFVRPHRRQPTRLPRPWDSPGKNTGVGCHFLLQCRKVKSESEVAQSCPTLRDPMDYSPPGSSVHGIFQARVLEWGVVAFSDSSTTNNKIQPVEWFQYARHSFKYFTYHIFTYACEVVQSCPTLCNPMDCSLPGSSVHGILQARPLEWVAISFSNAGK